MFNGQRKMDDLAIRVGGCVIIKSLTKLISKYLLAQPLHSRTMNAAMRTLVCPGCISVSTTNGGADKSLQAFNNTVGAGKYNPTPIALDNAVGYYTFTRIVCGDSTHLLVRYGAGRTFTPFKTT